MTAIITGAAKPIAPKGPNPELAAIAEEINLTGEIYGLADHEMKHLRKAYFFANISNGLVPDAFKGDVRSIYIMSMNAETMGITLPEVLQGGYFVQGRWGWYAEFKIKRALAVGFYTSIDYEVGNDDPGKPAQTLWVRAIGTRPDGSKIVGTTVSLKMAAEEGWTRNPKYKTMPVYMLKKRASSFLINETCPHIFGQSALSTDEAEDIAEAEGRRAKLPKARTTTIDILTKDFSEAATEEKKLTETAQVPIHDYVEPAAATEPEPQPAPAPEPAPSPPAADDEKHRLDMLAKVNQLIDSKKLANDVIVEKAGMPKSMIQRQPLTELVRIYKAIQA